LKPFRYFLHCLSVAVSKRIPKQAAEEGVVYYQGGVVKGGWRRVAGLSALSWAVTVLWCLSNCIFYSARESSSNTRSSTASAAILQKDSTFSESGKWSYLLWCGCRQGAPISLRPQRPVISPQSPAPSPRAIPSKTPWSKVDQDLVGLSTSASASDESE